MKKSRFTEEQILYTSHCVTAKESENALTLLS